MRKQHIVILMVALISFLMVLPALSQEDMEVVPGDSFERQRRPSAVFRHDDHNDTAGLEECSECHHVYENGEKLADESSEGERCADCHTEKDADGQPGLRKAFHINCKGCHLSKKQGPVMCGECHVRRTGSND